MRAEIAPEHEQAVNEFLRGVDGGRISVAAADALTVTHPPRQPVAPTCASCAPGRCSAGSCHDLIGPDARLYWEQAVYKLPHNPDPVPWHQDNGYTYVEPQAYLTCWVALVDATLDNGCVWVVPGLHRRGTLDHWDTELGFRCLPDGVDGAVAVPVRGRLRRRVLVAHAALDRAERHRRRCAAPTSCSSPPTAPRPSGATPPRARRPARTAWTTRAGSTRC